KAGVSRQREYLADAAAVQFTRNPSGIAGALKKIGGFGSAIEHPKAEEASHMFFGSSASFSALLATHPPLGQRIKRIDPSFDEQQAMAAPMSADALDDGQGYAQVISGFSPQHFVEAVGDPQPSHVALGHDLLAQLPQHV
ncbi:M48 family metalloprotease, partial [Arthrospira platensis SPKY2]